MKTRIVHTKVWKDEFFAELELIPKLLFLYLITNERINLSGRYEITDREILFDLSISKDQLLSAKESLSEKFIFDNGWVIVKNHDKYNNYSGEKNEIAKMREMEYMPKGIQDRYPIDTVLPNGDTLRNQKPKTINKKSEIINKKTETIKAEIRRNLSMY